MADPEKQMKTNQIVLIAMSGVLLFGAYNALYGLGEEYDPEFYVWFNIAIDAAMTLLAVVLAARILTAPTSGLKLISFLAGLVGIAAGLTKLYVRFSSDIGYWTGHMASAL